MHQRYTVSSAFSSGVLETALHSECDGDSTITAKFDGVTIHYDSDDAQEFCDVLATVGGDEWTAGEITAIDALVAAHGGP